MSYEVELKFPLDGADEVTARLQHLQALQKMPVEQTDRYFNHPARDFAETDEALRIRTAGDRTRLTYKGPLLDERTKTRREIELSVGGEPADAERLAELLTALGFREIRAVRKTRTVYCLTWEEQPCEIALDDVSGLGFFVEIETTAEDDHLDAARNAILRLADHLGLNNPIRTSYLQLLLKKGA